MCSNGKVMRKTMLHPYTPAMVNYVEKWLTKMSLDGWKLVDKKGWQFCFVRSRKEARHYFIYSGFDASKGISYDFYRAKDIYAKSKADINKRLYDVTQINKRVYDIFEVAPCKIDRQFYDYRIMRNRYYRNHYVKLAIFSFVFIALSLIGLLINPKFWISGVPFLISFVYAVISAIMLSQFIKQ